MKESKVPKQSTGFIFKYRPHMALNRTHKNIDLLFTYMINNNLLSRENSNNMFIEQKINETKNTTAIRYMHIHIVIG